jgi:hypothetical protein
MKGMGSHQATQGATDTWLTPREIVEALGPFDLDPCAAPNPRPWPTAARHITLPENGLVAAWDGLVWLNPPYSEAGIWLERLAAHGQGIALVFARTETKAWQDTIFPRARSVLFLRRRVRFCAVDGSPGKFTGGAPSALVAFGIEASRRLVLCEDDSDSPKWPRLRTRLPGYLVFP